MIFPALLLAVVAPTSAMASDAPLVDALMAEVTVTCLLPDMATNDPREALKSRGWTMSGDKFEKRLSDAKVVVEVDWPASAKASASCSFSTSTVTAFEAYDFFRKRIGEPNDIPWSDKSFAGWNIMTNGHDAGIYISRNNPGAEKPGLLLHILQK